MYGRFHPSHQLYSLPQESQPSAYKNPHVRHLPSPVSLDHSCEHQLSPFGYQPYPIVSRPASGNHTGHHHDQHGYSIPQTNFAHSQPTYPIMERHLCRDSQISRNKPAPEGQDRGQISLLAEVAMREAEDDRARILQSSAVSAAHHHPAQDVNTEQGAMQVWYQGYEGDCRGHFARYPYPSQQRDSPGSHTVGEHTTFSRDHLAPPSRHPLSGLSLDSYSSYTPTKFEENVRKILSTPTFIHAATERSDPNLSSTNKMSLAPQWPPHQDQIYGRADPETGRAWTLSLDSSQRPRPSTSPLERSGTRSEPQFQIAPLDGRPHTMGRSSYTPSIKPLSNNIASCYFGDYPSLPGLDEALPSVGASIGKRSSLPFLEANTSLSSLSTSHAPSQSSTLTPIRLRTPSSEMGHNAKRMKLAKQCESLQSTQTFWVVDEQEVNSVYCANDDSKMVIEDKSPLLDLPRDIGDKVHLRFMAVNDQSSDTSMLSAASPGSFSPESTALRSVISEKRLNSRAHSCSLSSAVSAPIKPKEPMIVPSSAKRPRRAKSEGIEVEPTKQTTKRGGPRRRYQNKVAARRHRDKKKMLAEQMEDEVLQYRLELDKREVELRSIRLELEAALRELEGYRKG